MSTWKIDPDHSTAAFSVRHMMISDVHGQFNSVSGTISFDPDDAASSSVEVGINASGIYTGITKRDEHLRSADFLDIEKHPKITFKSTHIEPAGLNRFKVHGALTIKGIMATVTLNVKYAGPVKDPFEEGTSYGFSAATKINRQNYGMTWNFPMLNGGVVVGELVTIMLEVEADLVS